jgi:hypothetical protein
MVAWSGHSIGRELTDAVGGVRKTASERNEICFRSRFRAGKLQYLRGCERKYGMSQNFDSRFTSAGRSATKMLSATPSATATMLIYQ